MAGCATTAEVIADLQPRIEIIVQEILNGIKEWNVKEINRIVYNYSPSWYERTYAFRDKMWDGKITQAGGGSATGEFTYYPENGYHPSEYGSEKYGVSPGDDVSEYLADIIYEGIAHDIFGHWKTPHNAWKELIRIVGGSKMRSWINKGASKAGLKISWK